MKSPSAQNNGNGNTSLATRKDTINESSPPKNVTFWGCDNSQKKSPKLCRAETLKPSIKVSTVEAHGFEYQQDGELCKSPTSMVQK